MSNQVKLLAIGIWYPNGASVLAMQSLGRFVWLGPSGADVESASIQVTKTVNVFNFSDIVSSSVGQDMHGVWFAIPSHSTAYTQ